MKKTTFLILKILCLCSVSTCAQKNDYTMAEKNEKHKELNDLRRMAIAAKQSQESIQENFKKASDMEDTKKYLAALPFINDEVAARKALPLFQDRLQEVSVRIMAMEKVTNILVNDTAFITTCLDILKDRTNDPVLRKAALNTLKILRFSSQQLRAMNAEYMDALRKLIDDPENILRVAAVETLALNKDEYVQRRLMEDITKPEQTIVSRAKAIQLLGHDIHAEQFPIVRMILEEKTATESEKIEAIHVLGKDPTSKDLLKNLMLDKKQSQEIRLSSASALQAAQPETFINVAKEVILNEKEDKGLRVLCLNGIIQNIDHKDLENDDEFLQAVSKLGTNGLSRELKKVSKIYVDRMNLKKGKAKE
jgi:hypothetical protein